MAATARSGSGNWAKLTMEELRTLLYCFGLPTDGGKATLVSRLAQRTVQGDAPIESCGGGGFDLGAAAACDGLKDDDEDEQVKLPNDDAVRLIRWMLEKAPRQRPTIGQVLEHVWLRENSHEWFSWRDHTTPCEPPWYSSATSSSSAAATAEGEDDYGGKMLAGVCLGEQTEAFVQALCAGRDGEDYDQLDEEMSRR